MVNTETFIQVNPNKQERVVPDLNGQKTLNTANSKTLERQHKTENEVFISYEDKKKKIFGEAKEQLNKEQLIYRAKIGIYEEIGINNNLSKNNPLQNFAKGVIDELIIGNYDLALEIINTNGAVLLDALNQLMSVEGMKALAKGLEDSAIKLATGNAYEKGRSFIELGLTGVGAFAGLKIAKFGMKKLKHIDIPKHNFDKLSVSDISKLSDNDRLEAASFYLKKDFTKDQKNAILQSHEVGINREGAGIHNYNFSEKREKLKILEQAGFTKGERKLLLEKGVCGRLTKIDYSRITETLDTLSSQNNLKVIDVSSANDIHRFTNNLANMVTIIERINIDLPSLPLEKQRELIKSVSLVINRIDNFAIRVSENKYLKNEQKRFITQSINAIYKDKALNIRKYSGKNNGIGIDHRISHMHDYHQVRNKI